MLPRPILFAVDEAHRLPVVVDRRALVVDEPGRETDVLHRCEVQIRLDLRGPLRPGDPQAVRGGERPLESRKPPAELVAARREVDEDVCTALRPELLAER